MKMRSIIYIFFISLILYSCGKLKSVVAVPSFDHAQEEYIMSAGSNVPMRVFKITNKEDSILLRTKCANVIADSSDRVLQVFAKRLHRTVIDSLSMGVGIAAPQVGILRNIICVQRFDIDGFPFEIYLNPRILQYSDLKQPCLEGCLSIPNRMDTTRIRAYAILLDYDKLDGSHKTEMIEDFTAVIFQHEIDHLNGILYIDHLEEHEKKD